MLDKLHITVDEATDYALIMQKLRENYRDELEFIQNLPTIIETEKFIFVHGGIRGKIPTALWKTPQNCLKKQADTKYMNI